MTRLVSGSFGSRMGASWSTEWADYLSRRNATALQSTSASLQETVTPPSREALRRAIESETCPFCGAGPYKNLGLHTHKTHGMSAAELRTIAGVKRVCSKALSDKSRERLVARPDREEITRKGHEASVTKGCYRLAAVESMKRRERVINERGPLMAERAAAGERLDSIASDFGVSRETVRRTLARLGVEPTLTQTNRDRRLRLENSRAVARASLDAALAAQSRQRVARFHELGADWIAVGRLANEAGVSEKTMRAYLRKHGVALPDGRAVTHRKRGAAA